jgi:hypothetical protein
LFYFYNINFENDERIKISYAFGAADVVWRSIRAKIPIAAMGDAPLL